MNDDVRAQAARPVPKSPFKDDVSYLQDSSSVTNMEDIVSVSSKIRSGNTSGVPMGVPWSDFELDHRYSSPKILRMKEEEEEYIERRKSQKR